MKQLPAEARARLRRSSPPAWVAPMLATLVDKPFSRAGWLFEPKFDGERCIVVRRNGETHLYSRNHLRLDGQYPEVMAACSAQKTRTYIADGELVTFKDGVTSFTALQQRMHVERPSAALLRAVPVVLYVFDLLYLGQYDTRRVPLRYRKILLRDALDFGGALRYTEHRERDGEAYYREACTRGWEGIIAKNGDSAYVSRRTRDWLKFKCVKEQEFVIGGFTDPQGGRVGFGALLVGYYKGGKLIYAGKVGTGFDTETLQNLGRRLKQLEIDRSPFASDGLPRRRTHWVKPKLVAEIRFTEWTRDGKLRHPRFMGLRDDKRPTDVVREG